MGAEPHHVRDKSITPKRLRGGTGLKPSDYMSIPLCRECHSKLHNGNIKLEKYVNLSSDIIDLLVNYIGEVTCK